MILSARAKARHLRLGRRGENLACRYLEGEGFDILERNLKNDSGEIDIIARDGAIICFIEVKTRRATSKSRPAEGLSERQKTRIRRAAMRYLRELGHPKTVYRFDLVEAVLSDYDVREFRYWQDNFGGKTGGTSANLFSRS